MTIPLEDLLSASVVIGGIPDPGQGWAADTYFAEGSRIKVTNGSDYVYEAMFGGGTTGSTAPTWVDWTLFPTVLDGSIFWVLVGKVGGAPAADPVGFILGDIVGRLPAGAVRGAADLTNATHGGVTDHTASVSIGFTPTAGNTLIAIGCFKAPSVTSSPPSGWMSASADLDWGITTCFHAKISDGTETTWAPGWSADNQGWNYLIIEVSGAIGVDVSNTTGSASPLEAPMPGFFRPGVAAIFLQQNSTTFTGLGYPDDWTEGTTVTNPRDGGNVPRTSWAYGEGVAASWPPTVTGTGFADGGGMLLTLLWLT